MPVLSEDGKAEKCDRNFLRIQNLPWTACTSDIKHFFKGLAIKQGGILMRNFEAYVAFENPSDIPLALYRRNILLHGCKLELSVVDEVTLSTILDNIVRRKLDFDSMNKRAIEKLHFVDFPTRKIRPTPVVKGNKPRSASCSTFLPTEIDPGSVTSNVGDFSSAMYPCKRSVTGMRRVHPTSVSYTDMENFAVFHPEECQPKKIKREE